MSTMSADGDGNKSDANSGNSADGADEMRFDDLAAAGADERTIAVARALAEARSEAPASLAGVRWAAVANPDHEVEATAASASSTIVPAPTIDRVAKRGTAVPPRRRWGREGRWVTQVVVGAVGVALVAVLWAWVVPWLEATTIQRPERRERARHLGAGPTAPPGPADGRWTLVDQIGGPVRAIGADGERLVIGRGRRIEVYDPRVIDGDNQPTLVSKSPLLGGTVTSLAIVGDHAFATLWGRSELVSLQLRSQAATLPVHHAGDFAGFPVLTAASPVADDAERRLLVISKHSDGTPGATLWSADGANSDAALKFQVVWSTDRDVRDLVATRDMVFVAAEDAVHVIDLSAIDAANELGVLPGVTDSTCLEVEGDRLFVGGTIADKSGIALFELEPLNRYTLVNYYFPAESGQNRVLALTSARQLLYVALDGSQEDPAADIGRIVRIDLNSESDVPVDEFYPTPALSLQLVGELLAIILNPTPAGFGAVEHAGELAIIDPVNFGTDSDWRSSDPASVSSGSFSYDPLLLSDGLSGPILPWDAGIMVPTRTGRIGTELRVDESGALPTWSITDDGYQPAVDLKTGNGLSMLRMSAQGHIAAALLARYHQGQPIEVAPIVWTPDENPSDWPMNLDDLGDRLSWLSIGAPYNPPSDYSISPDSDPLDFPFAWDWSVFSNDHIFVAVVGLMSSHRQRILIYDTSQHNHPRLIRNDEIDLHGTDSAANGLGDARAYPLLLDGDHLYFRSSHDIIAINASGTSAPTESARIHSSGWFGNVVLTPDSLLATVDRRIGVWRLNNDRLPRTNEPERTIDLGLNVELNETISGLAWSDGHAYVAARREQYLDVLDFDLNSRNVDTVISLPTTDFEYGGAITVHERRIFLYDFDPGTYIFERRPE